MTLSAQINGDYTQALKRGETNTVNTLRLVRSALHNETIALGRELNEAQTQAVLGREAKKRREAIALYRQADREETAAAEESELALIESYLPKALGEAALQAIVEEVIGETGASTQADMGRAMATIKEKLTHPEDISRAARLMIQKLG